MHLFLILSLGNTHYTHDHKHSPFSLTRQSSVRSVSIQRVLVKCKQLHFTALGALLQVVSHCTEQRWQQARLETSSVWNGKPLQFCIQFLIHGTAIKFYGFTYGLRIHIPNLALKNIYMSEFRTFHLIYCGVMILTTWQYFSFIYMVLNKVQSFPNTTCGYRRLSLAALAGLQANQWGVILMLLPNTHSVISAVSEQKVTCIDVHLQSRDSSVY